MQKQLAQEKQKALQEQNKVFEVNGQLVQKQPDGSYGAVYQGTAKENVQFIPAQYDQLGNLLQPPSIFDKNTQVLRPIGAVGGEKNYSGGMNVAPQGGGRGFQSPYLNSDLESAMRTWSGGGYGSEIAPQLRGKTISQLNDNELNAVIQNMAQREGYGLAGKIPTTHNNPGDIKVPGAGLEEAKNRYNDPGITLGSMGRDGGQFLRFSSPEKGFAAMKILLTGRGGYINSQNIGTSPSSGIPKTESLIEKMSRGDISGVNNQNILSLTNNLNFGGKDDRLFFLQGLNQKMAQGDIEGAFRAITTKAYQQMNGTQQEKYNDADNGGAAYEQALQFLNTNNITSGPYKELLENKKPYLLIDKDPKYAQLKQFIALAEAPIRRAFFGTAVTTNEAGTAKGFLLDPTDDIGIIRQKLENNLGFFKFFNDMQISKILGDSRPKLQNYIKSIAKTGGQIPGYDSTQDLFSNLPK